ncbi:RluA family pseudouridine synthase [Paenibacillus sp. SC116]|uniref:RluA family pseudouridine synthase n=1 Tax=Paenibacillus sp. SC116 TaxID=2968986 RepID=UPI00215B2797|nr:RluA family pseudouridine synthase [Paenibacillus sp. SC116]MCR8843807.1 RluA family pseudouridine synthase [Paenibacillus sp. SC116]
MSNHFNEQFDDNREQHDENLTEEITDVQPETWDAAELTYCVAEDEAGIMLRTVLLSRLKMSRRLITRLKRVEGGLTVNGSSSYGHKPLQAGDVVRVRIAEPQVESIQPEPIPIEVIYEDQDILVVHKPPNLVVHPTYGFPNGTLANGIVHYWRSRGEQTRFRPVHRLDQETSGVLLIAKHAYAHQQLSEQLQRGDVFKRYVAYVEGAPQPPQGTVHAPIDRDPEERHLRIVTPEGYPSTTHYETIASYHAKAAKIKCVLETGRTHQIRVHMQHIGCPLIGDKFYNPDSELRTSMKRHALHAAELHFYHPMTGERVCFTAPLPADLVQLEQELEHGAEL